MVNATAAGTHRFDEVSAQAARPTGRHLVIEDLDASGQSDVVLFCVTWTPFPMSEAPGRFAA
ncbi:hypothetical protein ACFOZ0_18225 [Streptomyces yaanensis]|uniref:Uncharacterized protein n=1 Tax=Streptomyces yaanensis TaxID=1142239 RepID=A0ABV7SE00_9ACTN|nr:hypothetical protein [Streptomyces sp. CGMCC 4.7035]WNB99357.1 hypothetical protein Q2K21_15440 [Streptomyces sp. CGMCC 4.7035]